MAAANTLAAFSLVLLCPNWATWVSLPSQERRPGLFCPHQLLEVGCTRREVDFRGWVEGLVQDEILQFWGWLAHVEAMAMYKNCPLRWRWRDEAQKLNISSVKSAKSQWYPTLPCQDCLRAVDWSEFAGNNPLHCHSLAVQFLSLVPSKGVETSYFTHCGFIALPEMTYFKVVNYPYSGNKLWELFGQRFGGPLAYQCLLFLGGFGGETSKTLRLAVGDKLRAIGQSFQLCWRNKPASCQQFTRKNCW